MILGDVMDSSVPEKSNGKGGAASGFGFFLFLGRASLRVSARAGLLTLFNILSQSVRSGRSITIRGGSCTAAQHTGQSILHPQDAYLVSL